MIDGGAQQHGADQRTEQRLPGQAHGGCEPAFALHAHGSAGRGYRKRQLHRHGQQHIPAEEQQGQRTRASNQCGPDEENCHHRHHHHSAFVRAANGVGRTAGHVAR
jgi:hypothetical protein